MQSSTVAAGLVALEGAAAIVAGIVFVVAALVGSPSSVGVTIALGVLLAVYGSGIVLVARGVLRRRSWSRTPAYLVQFFALVVAWYQRSTLVGVTVAVGLVAVTAIAALTAAQRAEN